MVRKNDHKTFFVFSTSKFPFFHSELRSMHIEKSKVYRKFVPNFKLNMILPAEVCKCLERSCFIMQFKSQGNNWRQKTLPYFFRLGFFFHTCYGEEVISRIGKRLAKKPGNKCHKVFQSSSLFSPPLSCTRVSTQQHGCHNFCLPRKKHWKKDYDI